jgi:hypothetical protein
MYGPKVFLLTKIKPEYSSILYNSTHLPGSLVCRIRQVPLYIEMRAGCVNDFKLALGKLINLGTDERSGLFFIAATMSLLFFEIYKKVNSPITIHGERFLITT